MDEACVKPRAQIGILPLFSDKDASFSMMKHTNDIVKHALNWSPLPRRLSLALISHYVCHKFHLFRTAEKAVMHDPEPFDMWINRESDDIQMLTDRWWSICTLIKRKLFAMAPVSPTVKRHV